mmetsp:Transcript_73110/g.237798  ORF Transcript_73110/g.237798 Transcript_73110/m.237798 type:complete len:314 (+) Transcript_73110:88-1029(+)
MSDAAVAAAVAESGGFGKAFLNALGMIFATEIGDKTFFIAAILAMSQPRLVVFTGAISALIVMTVLSTIFGHLVPQMLPPIATHWASILLFLYFGGRMIWSAAEMYRKGEGVGVSEEMEEVEHELAEKGLVDGAEDAEDTEAGAGAGVAGNEEEEERELIGKPSDEALVDEAAPAAEHDQASGEVAKEGSGQAKAGDGKEGDVVSGTAKKEKAVKKPKPTAQQILTQAFILTFLAEWGDRSQIATIVLGASQDPFGVTLGACIGHSFCTGMAVVGGRLLASRISERQVSMGGGVLFILFAAITVYLGPPSHSP